MIRFISRLSVLLIFSLAPAGPGWALDCSSPPQGFGNAWWNDYASWCRSCGGSPDKSTTSCIPGPNWGGGGFGGFGGYGTGDPAMDMTMMFMEKTLPTLFNAIGEHLACEIDPNCPRKVQQQQLEEQERQRREARHRAAADDIRRKKIDRKSQFEESKQDLLGDMRRQTGSSDLRSRDLTLQTREVAGTLQARTLAPRDLVARAATGVTRLSSPLARARCGTFLLQKSEAAAARGDFQEASFLSREAAALLGGEKVTTAVECPTTPDAPEVGEGIAVETKAHRQKKREIQQALEKRSRFISSIYRQVAEHSDRSRELDEAIRRAEERKKQAGTRLEEARRGKRQIETRAEPPGSLPSGTPESGTAEPESASALAEALAALEAAETAYAEAENDLLAGLDEKADIERQLQQTHSLFDDVRQDPAKLNSALEQLAKSSPGGEKYPSPK